jgi:hypothetical protein
MHLKQSKQGLWWSGLGVSTEVSIGYLSERRAMEIRNQTSDEE